MGFFIAEAAAQSPGAPTGGQGGFGGIILIVGMFIFMYFLIIRPQRKRQKEHEQLTTSLSKGDEVVLTSGMIGKIREVDDTYITLEAGSNILLRFQKIAVHAVLPKGTIKSIQSTS